MRCDVSIADSPAPAHPSPRPQKANKTVRIASPPVPASSPPLPNPNSISSTSPDQYTPFKGQPIAHRGSPPPPSPPEAQDTDSVESEHGDPFRHDAEGSGSDEEGSDSPDVQWSAHGHLLRRSDGGPIVNASMSNASQPSLHRRSYSSNHANVPGPPAAGTPDSTRAKRATLDVDAFKRLLMTGDAGDSGLGLSMRNAADGTLPSPARPTDGASSRYDENIAPVSQASAGEKRKPPPPKTRHGRLIRSVDEGALSASPAQSSIPSISTSPSIHPERQPKPLPRTPSEVPMTPTTTSAVSSDSTQVSTNQSSQFRRPPTPPLARRHSQMKQDKYGISRSNSARLPINSNTLNTSNLGRRTSMPKTPPPPPSPRREGALSSPTSIPPTSTYRSSSLNTPPRPPESPNDSPDNLSIHRSASGSIKGFSRQSSTSNVPPRPPPPRRSGGGSNRASLDDTRPVIPTQTEPEPVHPPSHANDILADLSKLQQEVDSLRGQYKR